MTRRPPVAAASVTVLGVVLAAVLSGCGTASAPSPPTGVDELVIPTPTPDHDDFVAGVDNPWFPLTAGRAWTYVVADQAGTHRLRVSVADGPEIDGVATTSRVSVERGRTTTDWYAQDTRGNVWWFGREGEWQAGQEGAEAGVAMLAAPRVGDGYRTAYAEGVVEDHATVTEVDDDTVETDVVVPLPEPTAFEATYRRGTGLVLEDSTGGTYRVVRLSED